MAEPQESRERLKFKRFLVKEGPLMPQGYRLATVEDMTNNLEMFKKWQLPVKRISRSYEERSGDIRLLDGWMPADRNAVHEGTNYNCIWNAVVKKKTWNSSENKWQNWPDFYSSGGFSLRMHLYDGIKLSLPEKIETAWLHAYCYEDVELLYWLWQTYRHSIVPENFIKECQLHHIMGSYHSIPLRKMVRRLGFRDSKLELEMENEREEAEAVLRYAIDRSRDGAGFIYLYGPTWGVATVELAEKIYGQAFVEAAASFENAESVPIATKLLSLLPDRVQNQIANLQHPVAKVLIEAVKRGYSRLVAEMIRLEDNIAHILRDDYVPALTEAVSGGYIDLVEHLLNSRNVDDFPREVDEDEKTLFHYALLHKPVFSLLYRKYADSLDDMITRQDKFGRNVLHWAAKRGYDSWVVDRLLHRFSSRKSLIHSKDHQSRTPWHIAASKGDREMIAKLRLRLGSVDSPKTMNYIQATDSSGHTALQIAAREGHEDLVRMLLDQGSCPLKERDGQRKTALHHAAQVKNPKAALATCKALLEHGSLTPSNRSLLLWASAIGFGTADEMEDVHHDVKIYLQTEKRKDTERENREPLLGAAAINNNVEMAWELLSRGADIAGIRDLDWTNSLQSSEKESVKNVLSQIEHIKEHGRDQPSIEDKLVGISGEWGMGKSSLMFQTEKILLITAAQLTFPNLLPSEQFVGVKKISPSTRGRKIYQRINRGVHDLLDLSKKESKKQNPLVTLLKEYQPPYHDVYKALACMDNNQMSRSVSRQEEQEHALREVPRILTIRYNAWHYRDQHEAWAGLGVAISKEIENAMTRAQRMSTRWRYTWAKQSANIWIQLIIPSLLSIFLVGWVALIAWVLLKRADFHRLKYGSIPFTIIAVVWVVLKSVISVVKPVSTQMLDYVTSPNHTNHLGYQEDVIKDINFLKKELGKQPSWFSSFVLGVWCWNWFGLCADNVENTSIPKFMPASGHDIRIVTFVDDLDRCEEKVILQVLSAINLVLAECKINVILGMDKKMIERAIKRNFQGAGADLAEKFICKIIQIPLSLPDLTEQESDSFLEYHLKHKNPEKSTEKKNISKSQRGLVVPIEPAINGAARQNDKAVHIQYDEFKRRCKGIIERAVDWLNKLRQPYDESLNSLRSAEGVRLIREILLPNYTREEAQVFYKLKSLTTGNQKLPREWKRLLSYHKFAWYVLSLVGNVYSLPTWKVELVGWVFACWQWKREMNHLIKEWNKITIEQDNGRNRQGSHGPSLRELVTKCLSQLPNSDPSEVNEQGKKKKENKVNEQGISKKKLLKLEEALKRQDVSMEGIQLFQQFRLHCEIDHLPWPYG